VPIEHVDQRGYWNRAGSRFRLRWFRSCRQATRARRARGVCGCSDQKEQQIALVSPPPIAPFRPAPRPGRVRSAGRVPRVTGYRVHSRARARDRGRDVISFHTEERQKKMRSRPRYDASGARHYDSIACHARNSSCGSSRPGWSGSETALSGGGDTSDLLLLLGPAGSRHASSCVRLRPNIADVGGA